MIAGFLEFLHGVWSFIGRVFKAIGEWLRQPHDWWRITSFAGAAISAWLAVQWTGAEREAEVARTETIRVRAAYVAKLEASEQVRKAELKDAATQCALTQQKAVAQEYRRRLDAERKVRELEHELSKAMGTIAATFNREKQHAQQNGAGVTAGLIDGSLQLRDAWAGSGSNAGAPGADGATSGSAGGAHDGAEVRAASAGRIIAIADTCDAQVRGLQSVVTEYLKTNEIQTP